MKSVFLLHLASQLCLVTVSAANPAESDIVGSLVPVDSPEVRLVPPLPPVVTAPPYEVELTAGGGFIVKVKGTTYRIESSYSYPHGGENRLLAGASNEEGEESWKVKTRKLDESNYLVEAAGKYYSITRLIEIKPTCLVIKDTIRNLSDDIVGIILSNHVNAGDSMDVKVRLMNNLTVFVHTKDNGVGLIALDDLYQLQQRHRFSDGLAALCTEHFGLDKGASYTVEWAVYPTATSDYYDFINQVRMDEGLTRRVEGSFAFVPRRTPPAKKFMELLNLKYTSIGCLGNPPDDPTVSLEGIEFVQYPQECALLKETFAETRRMYPDVKVMFHVAHGLYACNNPEELFPDSRAIDVNGNQIHYGPNTMDYYGKYFSEERVNEGWRWWIFYPTMENSFGKAMLEAMRYMVDELGATGIWADGFISGYVPDGYSYDCWDGHSVTIDPETKLVTRKKTCVPWVALPVLKEVIHIIDAGGGVTITNGQPGSRSLWKENMIASCEGSEKALMALHLGRAPCSLSSEADSVCATYRDILTKLEYGSLYFWYRYKMDHKTLVEHMYPITIQSIHAGVIRGEERIITRKSGIYGWHGDPSLHIVYLYDACGVLSQSNFLTTVDDTGVRTDLRLGKDQSAALVKIPITLTASRPVNVNVYQYDVKAILMALNGQGEIEICVETGDFTVESGVSYRVTSDKVQHVVATDEGTLLVQLTLDGPVTLQIEKAQ